MCPPGPSSLSDIGVYFTDQELIMFLDKIQHGSPPPSNVLVDVNPFVHTPSSLPDDVWYFVLSDTEKETEIGVWEASGDSCQIYEDSKLTGWRSTLKFYIGPSDDRHITDWVMQKYWITRKGTQSVKAADYLCRVFPHDGEYRKQKRQRHQESVHVRGQGCVLREEQGSCDYQNCPTKVSEVNVRHDNTKAPDPAESVDYFDCFSRGDYLELQDLINPRSSTSSSDNTSSVSMASDEVFDYLALLNDLEPDNSKAIQSNSTSCHLSVSASAMPEVVVSPATRACSVTQDEGHSPGQPLKLEHLSSCPIVEGKPNNKSVTSHPTHKSVVDKGKQPDVNRSAQHDTLQDSGGAVLKFHDASSSQRPVTAKRKKISRGKMKMLKKKYLCFIPF